jgi:hypothetical protein
MSSMNLKDTRTTGIREYVVWWGLTIPYLLMVTLILPVRIEPMTGLNKMSRKCEFAGKYRLGKQASIGSDHFRYLGSM